MAASQDVQSNSGMNLANWLDDICVRFIINLPLEELSAMERISFHIEEAQWYYEDFIRPLDNSLPSIGLKDFFDWVFRHCPILKQVPQDTVQGAFKNFILYKKRVPVRGALLLNEDLDKVVLVKGWKKNSNWSFPRGKTNKDEDALECAIRETYEETGFDVRLAGLVPDEKDVKQIGQFIREQEVRLFVFRNVPEDTDFQAQTRKEISAIKWWKLNDLPGWRRKNTRGNDDQTDGDAATKANKFYMVAPFLPELRKWVTAQRRRDRARASTVPASGPPTAGLDEATGLEYPAQADEFEEQQQPDSYATAQSEAAIKRLLNIPVPESEDEQAAGRAELPAEPSIGQQNLGAVVDKNRGQAAQLLALLKKETSGSAASGAPSTLLGEIDSKHSVPHTPMDYTYGQAPQPRSPHYHYVHQPPDDFSSYPPPPSFPLNQQHQQDPSLAPPPPAYSQDAALSGPYQPLTGRRHLRNESVPLVHPQPLPPQVQTGLLTHGMNGTPTVPETQAAPMAAPSHFMNQHQQVQLAQQQLHAQNNSQRFHPQAGTSRQQHSVPQANVPHHQQYPYTQHRQNQQQAAQQLNSQQLSLLNAFKSDAEPPDPSPSNGNSQPRPQPQQQYGTIGDLIKATAAHPNPASFPQQGAAATSLQSSDPPVRPSLPTDDSRRSLLSLFTKDSPAESLLTTDNSRPQPTGLNTSFAGPPQAAGGATESPASAGSYKSASSIPLAPQQRRASGGIQAVGQAAEKRAINEFSSNTRSVAAGSSQQEALRAAARQNGGPIQMHPDVNLPYRAVGILTRPKRTGQSPVSGNRSPTRYPSPRLQQARASPLSNQIYPRTGRGSPHRRSSPRNIQPQGVGYQKRPDVQNTRWSGQHAPQQPPIGSPYGSSHPGSHTGSYYGGGTESRRMSGGMPGVGGGYTSPAAASSYSGAAPGSENHSQQHAYRHHQQPTQHQPGPYHAHPPAQPYASSQQQFRGHDHHQQTTAEEKQSLLALFGRGGGTESVGAAPSVAASARSFASPGAASGVGHGAAPPPDTPRSHAPSIVSNPFESRGTTTGMSPRASLSMGMGLTMSGGASGYPASLNNNNNSAGGVAHSGFTPGSASGAGYFGPGPGSVASASAGSAAAAAAAAGMSRQGSLGVGGGGSRRDSSGGAGGGGVGQHHYQPAPISPADEDFLMRHLHSAMTRSLSGGGGASAGGK